MTRAFQETALAADIAAGLARVETLFDSQLSSVFPAVNELCRYVERYRGKMLRPTLVLVSGLAFTDDGEPQRDALHLWSCWQARLTLKAQSSSPRAIECCVQ